MAHVMYMLLTHVSIAMLRPWVMVEMRMLPNSLADLIYVSRFVLLERRSRSELSRCSMDSRK